MTSFEIATLEQKRAAAAGGDAVLLQGRDCADSFDDWNPDGITSLLATLLRTSVVLFHHTGKEIIPMERITGQCAKPRSADTESRGDTTLDYEQAQTRRVPQRDGRYNLSTQVPWIDMRAADLAGSDTVPSTGNTQPRAQATRAHRGLLARAPSAGDAQSIQLGRARSLSSTMIPTTELGDGDAYLHRDHRRTFVTSADSSLVFCFRKLAGREHSTKRLDGLFARNKGRENYSISEPFSRGLEPGLGSSQ